MPAAAMCTRRKAMRMTMRRMMAHRTIMAITIITMTSIATTTIITAIPMLMTASKAPARPRRRAVVRTGAIKQDAARPTDHEGLKESEAAALYRLMTWLSASFPVGAFSYSSGIEWAVEAGDIGDGASLRDWLCPQLAGGTRFCAGA